MNTEPKDGTKNAPPPTEDEARGRVTAETVVASDGEGGIERLKALTRRIVRDTRNPVLLE